jgi:hypothetical protein
MSIRLPRRRICIHHHPHVLASDCGANLAILQGKLGSWFAARMHPGMFLTQRVRGMRRRKKSCVDIIIKRSTKQRLYCLHGSGVRCERSRKSKVERHIRKLFEHYILEAFQYICYIHITEEGRCECQMRAVVQSLMMVKMSRQGESIMFQYGGLPC